MSQFDFPRINFAGNISVNVGTGNNSPASSSIQTTDPYQVKALTRGMTDEEFAKWCMSPNAEAGGAFPGAWNYYGDMAMTFQGVTIRSVQTDFDKLLTSPAESELIGSTVSITPACMTDVDPFGVANSQVICDQITIENGSKTYAKAKPSKAFTRWINFQRSINLNGSSGASGTFQCVIPKELIAQSGMLLDLSIFEGLPNLKGIVIRYNMYGLTKPDDGTALAALYKDIDQKPYMGHMNPAIGPVMGTIAPWYEGEMKSITLARILNATGSFPNPNSGKGGNGSDFQLASSLAKLSDNYLSMDLSNTFPEGYVIDEDNPAGDTQKALTNKYDFGDVSLNVTANGKTETVVSAIPYSDMKQYLDYGGMIDLPLSKVPKNIKDMLPDGTLSLQSATQNGGDLQTEAEYMIATDEACIYSEQGNTDAIYTSEGAPGPVVVQAARKGVIATSKNPIDVTVYQFITLPAAPTIYFPSGKSVAIQAPASSLQLWTADAGAQMCTMQESSLPAPAKKSTVSLGTDFYLTLRVLPANDYSDYLNGTKPLTWDVLFSEVVQYYKLIYPGMGLHMAFAEANWQNMAATIYQRVSADGWDEVSYMPRTRDLSADRRALIQAWCKQYMPTI